MRSTIAAASLLATILVAQPASADVLMVPVGGTKPKPVPIHPDAKDSPEEVAKDAGRDLRDNQFYNKPGATRAQYDANWQECRLIARGSQQAESRTAGDCCQVHSQRLQLRSSRQEFRTAPPMPAQL